nr:immunoglobulin heavy chain junction region [Mus musculus]MBK4189267.1 immunoglobulin heavy chain junction region [Mus musculus]
CAREWGLYW